MARWSDLYWRLYRRITGGQRVSKMLLSLSVLYCSVFLRFIFALALKHGLMELSTKENTKKIVETAMEFIIIQTEGDMKANIKTIDPMDKEHKQVPIGAFCTMDFG